MVTAGCLLLDTRYRFDVDGAVEIPRYVNRAGTVCINGPAVITAVSCTAPAQGFRPYVDIVKAQLAQIYIGGSVNVNII